MTRWTCFSTAVMALLAHQQAWAAPPVSVYNGFWIGTETCSENIGPNPNPKFKEASVSKVTFNVTNGEAQGRLETSEIVNTYTLHMLPGGGVRIVQQGNYKNNANRAWLVEAPGVLNGGQINAAGKMTTADKSTVLRKSCVFELTNSEVASRLSQLDKPSSAEGAAKPAPAKAPAKSTKPEAAATSSATSSEAAKAPVLAEGGKPAPSAPAAVAGKDNAPPRVAAIGNVQEPPGNKTHTKVTANPVDKLNKKSPNDVWINFNPSITVQERQFCRLIDNYRTELGAATATQNQIKINETHRNLVQALNSLLPDGKFQGWVMRSVSVGQASDGSADILFQLPCDVVVGSNACDANPKNFYGTIPEGSRLYTELSKMTVGDFALVSGEFVYADPKVFDKSRSVASFGFMKTADHCKAKSIAVGSDFFGIRMNTLSMIK